MKKKQKPSDFELGFSERDLESLFEPFDPDALSFQPPGRERFPVILAHGIFRPDYLLDSLLKRIRNPLISFNFITDRIHYFKGIARYLRKHGFATYHSSVSFAGSVKRRSEELKEEVQRVLSATGAEKVHIIAHSMGGLDARCMIVRLGMESCVASLTTIGTPHHGTSVADVALDQSTSKVIGLLGGVIDLEGIKSCTTENCQNFNQEVEPLEAANPVLYQAYASRQDLDRTFLPFQTSWKIIQVREGDSDGLIPYKSALWQKRLIGKGGRTKTIRRFAFPFKADHVDQMGWWNLNELHRATLWNVPALRRKNEYEIAVKNIYLKIAREVHELVNSNW